MSLTKQLSMVTRRIKQSPMALLMRNGSPMWPYQAHVFWLDLLFYLTNFTIARIQCKNLIYTYGETRKNHRYFMHIILLLLMISCASKMFDALFLKDYIKYEIQGLSL